MRPLVGSLGTLLTNAGRATVAAVLLCGLLLISGSLTGSVAAHVFLLGAVVLGQGGGDGCYVEAIRRLGVARALPIASSYPVFTAIIAVLTLGEDVSVKAALGIGLIVGGVYLVANPGRLLAPLELFRGETAAAAGLAVLAALFWAGGIVTMRRALLEIDVVWALVERGVAAAALLWLLGLWRERSEAARAFTAKHLKGLALAGLFTAGSSITFVLAISLAGAARAAVLTSTTPLFAAAGSIVLLREPFGTRLALGTALSVLGAALVSSG